MKTWEIRYSRTVEGLTTVEAETADEALDKVIGGDFEANHAAEEQVDWEPLSKAKELW